MENIPLKGARLHRSLEQLNEDLNQALWALHNLQTSLRDSRIHLEVSLAEGRAALNEHQQREMQKR